MNQSKVNSPTRWIAALWRRSWLIVLGAVVGAGIAMLFAKEAPIVYSSTTKIIVQEGGSVGGLSSSDIRLSSQMAPTYEALITTLPVLEEVSARLGMPAGSLRQRIHVNAVGNTRILAITATDSDSERSAQIADEVAAVFIEQTRDTRLAEIAAFQEAALAQGVTDLGTVLSTQLGGLNSIQVVEAALSDGASGGGGILREIILAGAVGFMIGVAISLLMEALFDVMRSKDMFESTFDIPVLAVLPKADIQPYSAGSDIKDRAFEESIRFLRTNLQFTPADRSINTILITSAEASSGKTTISTHLSVAIAESGKKILVIDADLRKPMISSALLGSKSPVGVSTFLSDEKQLLDDVIVPGPVDGLYVIPAGPSPPNPSDLLNTERFKSLLKEASGFADMVILDAPPTLAVSDTQIMAGQVDGVLVIVDTSRTRTKMLENVFQSLTQVQANVIGAALNKYRSSRFSYGYGYGTYYGYGGYGEIENDMSQKGARRFLRRLRESVWPGASS